MSEHGKTQPVVGARARIKETDVYVERTQRGWLVPPRARDLPMMRTRTVSMWEPDGVFTHSTRAMRQLVEHAHDYNPRWEHDTLAESQLWFVGAAMCDLLVGAAPALPSLPLTDAVLPDDEGLVVFEAPLAGVDADGSDHAVSVGAYMWGRARWRDQGTLATRVRNALGISVYGPGPDALAPLMPLGGLVWPFGEGCDSTYFGGTQRDQSMSEDRRRLLALWLLSSQPGLTLNVQRHTPQRTSKSKRKRIAAGKVPLDPPVRVVQLRRQPHPDRDAPTRPAGGRTYRHRWTVSGHWRNQAFGPAHSLRRPVYINPYLKGRDDAPLIGTERVKSWVR